MTIFDATVEAVGLARLSGKSWGVGRMTDDPDDYSCWQYDPQTNEMAFEVVGWVGPHGNACSISEALYYWRPFQL